LVALWLIVNAQWRIVNTQWRSPHGHRRSSREPARIVSFLFLYWPLHVQLYNCMQQASATFQHTIPFKQAQCAHHRPSKHQLCLSSSMPAGRCRWGRPSPARAVDRGANGSKPQHRTGPPQRHAVGDRTHKFACSVGSCGSSHRP
jgi:hypothetical protein